MKPMAKTQEQQSETQIYESFSRRTERKKEIEAQKYIEKRAARVQRERLDSFATSDINPMNHFFLRHAKSLSFVSLEAFHATFFHIIDTVKVRGMARNLKSGDISHYFKNQVIQKPVISGVVSGFMGSVSGSLTFITTFNYLTYYFYTTKRYADWDFRTKNFAIFMTSDLTASFAKIFFETRKQLTQMCNYQQPLGDIFKASLLGWFPLMSRDVLFRGVLLSFYYGTTNVEHKPLLKYSVPQIADFMKQRRMEGRTETIHDFNHLFYEFHNYDVKTKLPNKFLLLLCANLIGTLITNPIDVCLSKILTQQEPKYKGLFDCLIKVYKEEGPYKFLSGIHPRFMLNFFNGALFLFVYDRFVNSIQQIYE